MQQIRIMGILFTIAIALIAATTFGSITVPSAYAKANCDKATFGFNPQGNGNGNSKQCSNGFFTEGSKEPIRSCESPNQLKDNDGDGSSGCHDRGN